MIKIENLQFGYSKNNILFQDLNLEIKEGTITGLLGKNGAGKSTLLKIITGLCPINSGEVSVAGYNSQNRSAEVLSNIYFVPEELYIPSMSIDKYVKAYSRFYDNFNQERLTQILNAFELPLDGVLTRMSYGQKKKFIIGFALATGCKYLIFDEPTNGLDIPSKSIFRQVLASSVSSDQTVVISTHQVRDIDKIVDAVTFIDGGYICFSESLYSISNNYNFRTVPTLKDIAPIYSEPVIGGFSIIEKETNKESNIDLEVLFNAVVKGYIK